MPRQKGQLSAKQLAALAAGRAKRAQATAGNAPPRKTVLDKAEDFIEDEGLTEPVERERKATPHRKARPESMVTPELVLAFAAMANRTAIAFGGKEAAMTPDEAAGMTAPLLRIGARAAAKLIEKLFPAGINQIEDGNLRDLAASITSLGKYGLRQIAQFLWTIEAKRIEREKRGNRGPDTSAAPPAPPRVTFTPPPPPQADEDEGPAQAVPDVAAMAQRHNGNGILAGGMAALAGIVPTDTGQAMS